MADPVSPGRLITEKNGDSALFQQAENSEPNLFSQAKTGERPALENRGAERRHTVGIDLGNFGALALVNDAGGLVAVEDMPVLPDGPKTRPSVNPALLVVLLLAWQPARAFVEFVGPLPGDGPVGAFAFGKARGHVEATLAALRIPVRFLTAPAWKRTIGIPAGRDQKSTARAEACRRWPGHAASFARVKDDGRAEAALIAVAGQMREASGR